MKRRLEPEPAFSRGRHQTRLCGMCTIGNSESVLKGFAGKAQAPMRLAGGVRRAPSAGQIIMASGLKVPSGVLIAGHMVALVCMDSPLHLPTQSIRSGNRQSGRSDSLRRNIAGRLMKGRILWPSSRQQIEAVDFPFRHETGGRCFQVTPFASRAVARRPNRSKISKCVWPSRMGTRSSRKYTVYPAKDDAGDAGVGARSMAHGKANGTRHRTMATLWRCSALSGLWEAP